MNSEMKVPFIHGPQDLRMGEVPVPHAGPRDVVMQVAYAGICGSDLGYVAAGGPGAPTGQPMPLGHELAGVVVEVGAEVTSFALGDRVVLNPLVNNIGNGGPEGGFAQRLLVRDVVERPNSLLPLPDKLSFETGALVEPLAVAAHAVNRLGAKSGDKVAIFGAGPIGLATVVMLRHRGVEDVVVFDLSAFRRERALQLGARAALDPRDKPAAEALIELHGSNLVWGAQVPQTSHYVEASGANIIADIVNSANIGADLCVVSAQKYPVTLHFGLLLAKEITITTALGYPIEFNEVLDMLANHSIDVEPMISHRFKGDDFLAAFAQAGQPEHAAKVLVGYD